MSVPTNTALNTTGGTFAAVQNTLSVKYSDAGAWATYAATALETQLANLNTALDSSNLKTKLEGLKDTLDGIPDFATSGYIPSYIAPNALTSSVNSYVSATVPTYTNYAASTVETNDISLPSNVAPTDFPTEGTADIPVDTYSVDPTPTAPTLNTLDSFALGNAASDPTFTAVDTYDRPSDVSIDQLFVYDPYNRPTVNQVTIVDADSYVTPTTPNDATSTLIVPEAINRVIDDAPTFRDMPATYVVSGVPIPIYMEIPVPEQIANMPGDPTVGEFTDLGDVSDKLTIYHQSFVDTLSTLFVEAGYIVARTPTTISDITFETITDITLPNVEAVPVANKIIIGDMQYGVAQTQEDVLALLLSKASAISDAVLTKLNGQLAGKYNEITTQFSARGFDVPPGSMSALQAEASQESQYALADATAAIGKELIGSTSQIIGSTLQHASQVISGNVQANAQLLSTALQQDTQVEIENAKNVVNYNTVKLQSGTQIAIEGVKSKLQTSIENSKNETQIITAQLQSDTQIATGNIQYDTQLKSSKLQALSQTIASTQTAYSQYFERGLKYVMDKANISLETFKAKVNAQIAFLEASKIHIQTVGEYNKNITSVYNDQQQINLAQIGVNKEQFTLTDTINKSIASQFEDKAKVVLNIMQEDILYLETQKKINEIKAEVYREKVGMVKDADSLQVAIIKNQVDVKGSKVNEFNANIGFAEAESKSQLAMILQTVEANNALVAEYRSNIAANTATTEGQKEKILSQIHYNESMIEKFKYENSWVNSKTKNDLDRITLQIEDNKLLLEKFKTDLSINAADSETQVVKIKGQVDINSKQRQKDIIEAEYAETLNKGKYGSYTAAVQAIISQYNVRINRLQNENEILKGITVQNQGLIGQFEAESKGNLSTVQGQIAVASSEVETYKGQVQGAVAKLQSETEIAKLQATFNDLTLKKHQIIQQLSQEAMRIDIEYASKELQAELQVASSMTQVHGQMVAAALNGVSVSANLSAQGGWSSSVSHSESMSESHSIEGVNAEFGTF